MRGRGVRVREGSTSFVHIEQCPLYGGVPSVRVEIFQSVESAVTPFFLFSFFIPFTTFALLSLDLHSRNSDPESQSGLFFSPLPTTYGAFLASLSRAEF